MIYIYNKQNCISTSSVISHISTRLDAEKVNKDLHACSNLKMSIHPFEGKLEVQYVFNIAIANNNKLIKHFSDLDLTKSKGILLFI